VSGATAVLGRARRGVRRYGWRAFTAEAAMRTLRPALAPLAAHRLRRAADRAGGAEEILDLAFGFEEFGIGICPGQVRSELRELLDVLEREPPRRMLEIGTANGGSLFTFARTCAPDARVISVDLHHGEFGGGYPAWKVPLYRAFARRGQRLHLVRGDSHAAATRDRVRELLAGEPLDFLFIDGDHTYDGVRADFDSYSPLVRPGGLVGFHDIAPPRGDRPGEDRLLVGDVPDYWRELTAGRADARELVEPTGGGCFGIGLLRM
jgi:predicted O-methyltransferase YrrM